MNNFDIPKVSPVKQNAVSRVSQIKIIIHSNFSGQQTKMQNYLDNKTRTKIQDNSHNHPNIPPHKYNCEQEISQPETSVPAYILQDQGE